MSPGLPEQAPAATAEKVVHGFRHAMRAHAAGVTILTTTLHGRAYGMTATAVTSLCMTPPALTACINRDASIHDALLERGLFCVNILRAEAATFCRSFSAASSNERFDIGEWSRDDENDLPILAEAQASILCRLGPTLSFGSHTIVVGEVMDVVVSSDIEPLIYLDGGFRTIGAAA